MRLEHLKTHRMIHTGEKPFQVIYKKNNKTLFLIRNGTGPNWTLSLEYQYGCTHSLERTLQYLILELKNFFERVLVFFYCTSDRVC
jgi:hypothetical protein